MRAFERNIEVDNKARAMGSIVLGAHNTDPKVIERFNRPPYWPVLNFDKGEQTNGEK